jgi:aminomethyltransferase
MTTEAPVLGNRPRVLQPGLRPLPHGTERYRVVGGGATAVSVRAGDTVEIVDPSGRQACELVAFDAKGISDPGLLGATDSGLARGTQRILSVNIADARRVRAGLQLKGIDLAGARTVQVFETNAPAGSSRRFTAAADLVLIAAATGDNMDPSEQNPPTDLVLFLHRDPAGTTSEILVPNPLADPSQDFTVLRRTAVAYEVKAGSYIQILDIEGRECSDFQAFDARALDGGIESHLNATKTRSLMGATYPTPGLFSKFYDINLNPMLELIQDTVGRHDTFNEACSARYFEEMGYPGHINCTDNINAVLDPFGVAARRGWEAINFFYNTNVDDTNQIYFDEPWSRPGDYVLLRSLTDMVCVSTACPCDIDAANGWDPTDIQVRVYDEANLFRKATAFRMSTDAEPELTKETGFHPRTAELSRNVTEYQGYWLANTYTQHGAIDEYWACREAAAMIDLSPLRKYEVVGPDAEELMQTCVTRNIRKLTDGQVVYTAMCYETGGMIDDGTVFRLGRENFRWIGGSDTSGLWLRLQAQERGLRAWVRSSTDQLHNVQVQGPNSREIIWTRPDQPTIDELGWFRFTIARIGDHDGIPVVVSRTGYTGELGFEIFVHPSRAAEVWDALTLAGADKGLKPMGLEALDLLRIEAGLIFAGYEFSDQTDPYEAGIGFTVPLKTKEDDFIGRDSLVSRKANPQRQLVGLELEGGEIANLDNSVHVGRNQVGTITSGCYPPILRKNIALCRMSVEYSEIGTEVKVGKIDGHQQRIPALVVRFPFYDPEKTRVRDITPEI